MSKFKGGGNRRVWALSCWRGKAEGMDGAGRNRDMALNESIMMVAGPARQGPGQVPMQAGSGAAAAHFRVQLPQAKRQESGS